MFIPANIPFWCLCVALALAIVLWGWSAKLYFRGRRIAIPPSCRVCGYDVSQRPANSDRCSECGADLSRRDAITHHRYRAKRVFVVPLVLGVVCFYALVQSAWRFEWRPWYIRNAPTAWIVRHAQNDFSFRSNDMRREWISRDTRRAELLEHLLALQATERVVKSNSGGVVTSKVTWNWTYGAFVERTLLDGSATSEQRDRYYKHVITDASLSVSAKVRYGDPVPYYLNIADRGGNNVFRYAFAEVHAIDALPDFDPGRVDLYSGTSIISGARNEIAFDPNSKHTFAPGQHVLNMRFGYRLIHPQTHEPFSDWITSTATATFEIVPDTTVLATPIAIDIAETEAIAAAADLVVKRSTVGHMNEGMLMIRFYPAPVPRAFQVDVIRADGTRVGLGEVSINANVGESIPIAISRFHTIDLSHPLHIELIGSARAARRGIGMTQYWPATVRYDAVLATASVDDLVRVAYTNTTPTRLPHTVTLHATTAPTTRDAASSD